MADKCLHCQKGVRKAGRFSGSFYPVDRKVGDTGEGEEDDAKVHLECFEDYQAKLAEGNAAEEGEASGGNDSGGDTVADPEAGAPRDTSSEAGADPAADTSVAAERTNGTAGDTTASA